MLRSSSTIRIFSAIGLRVAEWHGRDAERTREGGRLQTGKLRPKVGQLCQVAPIA